MRLLNESWLDAYTKYTSSSDAPAIYHTWTAISTVAGALRNNVNIDLGYFTVSPHFYVCLVGPSGGRKTTAADIGMKFLEKIDGVRIKRDKITPERLIRFLGEDDIQIQNYIKSKTKKHTDNVVFKTNHTLFIYAPEFATLIGSTSYASSLQEILTRVYDGGTLEYSVVSQEDASIDNINLNLLACSTPEWLAKGISGDGIAGGFVGRFIIVSSMSYDALKLRALPILTKEQKELEHLLLCDLHNIAKMEGSFNLSDDVRDAYTKWFESGEYLKRENLEKGYFTRKPTHLLKLMMVLSAMDNASMEITLHHYERAHHLLATLESTLEDALMYIGASDELRIQQHIINLISERKITTYKQLVQGTRKFIKNLSMLQNVLNVLLVSGTIKKKVLNGENVFSLSTETQQTIDTKIKNIKSYSSVTPKQSTRTIIIPDTPLLSPELTLPTIVQESLTEAYNTRTAPTNTNTNTNTDTNTDTDADADSNVDSDSNTDSDIDDMDFELIEPTTKINKKTATVQ